MYCNNCGNEIRENAVVCIHCGCAVDNQPKQVQTQTPQKTNVIAIIGFVLSFFIALAGLICSIIGYKQADRNYNGNGKGFALAGTIISAVSLAIELGFAIWGIVWWISLWATIFPPIWS